MSYLDHKIRTASGRFAGTRAPLTDAQLEGLIAGATRLVVPAQLKWEWRRWPLARRGWFIRRLREKLQPPNARPAGPFSANVEPFDYSTPRAWEIVGRMNAGRNSRNAAIKLNISSQGVIYRDLLWFWVPDTGYVRGQWTSENSRPILHRHIWGECHGRTLTAGMVVWFLDGNHNNLAPENLALATKDDICRQNQAAVLQRKSRERTGLLLKLHYRETGYENDLHALRRT